MAATKLARQPKIADKMAGPRHCFTHGSATSMEVDKQDKSKNSSNNTPIQDSSGVELKMMMVVQQRWYSEGKPCMQERGCQAKQEHASATYSQSSWINHLDG